MLLRLILVLVLALAAPVLPAGAHDGEQPMAMSGHRMPGMDHNTHHKAPMPAQHVCVGCVPMGDWGAARVQPPIKLPESAPIGRIARLPLLPGEAPAPPPPRIA
jgi:hypothetical protein